MANENESVKGQEVLLTPDEVAAILKVPRQWIMEHVTRYEPIIPHRRFGRKIRFTRADVDAFVGTQLCTKPTWDESAAA